MTKFDSSFAIPLISAESGLAAMPLLETSCAFLGLFERLLFRRLILVFSYFPHRSHNLFNYCGLLIILISAMICIQSSDGQGFTIDREAIRLSSFLQDAVTKREANNPANEDYWNSPILVP